MGGVHEASTMLSSRGLQAEVQSQTPGGHSDPGGCKLVAGRGGVSKPSHRWVAGLDYNTHKPDVT